MSDSETSWLEVKLGLCSALEGAVQGGKIHIGGIFSSTLAKILMKILIKLNDIIHIIDITKNTEIK